MILLHRPLLEILKEITFMEQFVIKMVREKEDVEGKINHLSKALNSDNSRISKEERALIEEQRSHMVNYLDCLKKRLKLHNA